MIRKIFLLSSLITFSGLYSQKMHTVVKGDNPYNISKKYGISVDELYKLNPKVKDGKITLGEVLVVNKSGATKAVASEKTSSELGKIILQPKQTVYGITKQYQISEAELRKLNPNLDSHMKIGDEVVLPLDKINKFGGSQPVASNVPAANPQTAAVEVKAEENKDDEDSYQIQEKDNYYKLTRKFKLTQKELFALNPGLEARGLQPGEIIKVKGEFSDTDVSDRHQRKNLYFFIAGVIIIYLMYVFFRFQRMDWVLLFLLILLIVLQISNYFIKSSMHTALNVFVAALMFVIEPLFGIIWIVITVAVALSRVVLKRHTWVEVVSGAVIATAISFIYLYVQIQLT